MGAIGTGNVAPGVVSASLGTSGTIYAYCTKPVVDPRGEIAAFCSSSGGWLPLLCTMNVTMVTEQFRTLFGWDHAAVFTTHHEAASETFRLFAQFPENEDGGRHPLAIPPDYTQPLYDPEPGAPFD